MTQPIANLVYLTLRSRVDTPAEFLPFADRIVGVPSQAVDQISTNPNRPTRLYQVWGYRVLDEFFMVTPKVVDQTTRDFIDSLALPGSLAEVREVAAILYRDFNMPLAQVRAIVLALATHTVHP